MRISTRVGRGTWLSMGPVGWLTIGPFLLMFFAALIAVMLAVYLVIGLVRLVVWASGSFRSSPVNAATVRGGTRTRFEQGNRTVP